MSQGLTRTASHGSTPKIKTSRQRQISSRRATVSHIRCLMPVSRKPRLLINVDLAPEFMDELMEANNAKTVKGLLRVRFGLSESDKQDEVILDLYFYMFQFARENKLSGPKISVFISIMKNVFEYTIESPLTNIAEVFKYFKGLIVTHSVNRSPWSLEVFSKNDVKIISRYVVNTFFRHFRMYKYCFTSKPELDLTISYVGDVVKPSRVPMKGMSRTESLGPLPKMSCVFDPELVEDKDSSEEQEEAREKLKEFIKQFLMDETKKIEDDVETHIKDAVTVLNGKIESFRGSEKKKVVSRKHSAHTKAERSKSLPRIQSRLKQGQESKLDVN